MKSLKLNLKLFSSSVTVLLPALRSEKDGGNTEHGNDDEDIQGAPHLLRDNQHLGEGRIQGELHHLPTKICQLTSVVQSSYTIN